MERFWTLAREDGNLHRPWPCTSRRGHAALRAEPFCSQICDEMLGIGVLKSIRDYENIFDQSMIPSALSKSAIAVCV